MSNEPSPSSETSPQPLAFYGDQQRIMVIFYWFIGLMLVSLLAGIAILLSNNNVLQAILVGFSALPVLLAIYIVRRKKFEGAATLLALSMIVTMTLLATSGQGVHNITIIGFPAVLIVASLVMRKRVMAFLTLFCIACVAWLVFGDTSGLYSPNQFTHSVPGDFFSVSLILIATAVMVRLITESLFRSNRRLQKELTERQQAEQALLWQAHEMSLLYRFGLSLATGQELESALKALKDDITQLVQADAFFVAIYDESTGIVSYPIALDVGQPLNEPPRDLRKSPGLTGAVIFGGKTIYLPDLLAPEMQEKYRPVNTHAVELHTFLGVPLISRERVIGMLSVQSRQVDAYSTEQIQLVENLAVQAALAIDKANLLEQLKHELAERKQAEEARSVAEARYRVLVEQIPAITYVDIADGSALSSFVSPQIESMLGIPREEWLQGDLNYWANLIHPDDRERVISAYKRTVETGQPFNEEYRILPPDGRIVWIEDHAAILKDAADQSASLHGLMFDISERKKAEETIRQANLVVENSPVVLFRWKAAEGWPVELVSNNVSQFGYTPQELLSGAIPYAAMIHPDDLERVAREVREYSASGVEHFQQEYRIVTSDGQVRWTDDRTVVVRDAEGKITHYQGIVMDISERKRAEQFQLASHQIAEAALTQNLPEFYQSVYAIVSPLIPVRNFYITLYDSANDTFSTPFLVDEFDSRWPPYHPGKGLGAYVLRTGQPLLTTPESFAEMERLGLVEIISRRMVEWLGVPLKTRQGKIIGVMAAQNYSGRPRLDKSHMDLLMFVSVQVAMAIERMQVEAERERLISELTAKNNELERFTYTVSHDLKSPLITIRGFLGYLEEDALGGNIERLREDIQRITNASTKMYKLLDELLILSRIGRIINPPVTVRFEEIAREALGMVEGRLRQRRIEVRIEPDLPTVHGDRPRLVEVVQNLADNAAKFMGKQSEPRIEVGQRGVDADGKPILFVRDNGIGFEPQYQEKIFGLFNKLDSQTEGTGVGLTLVKRIIEVHGGRIWVESEPGKGSTFFFTLPRGPEPEAGA